MTYEIIDKYVKKLVIKSKIKKKKNETARPPVARLAPKKLMQVWEQLVNPFDKKDKGYQLKK